MPGTASSAMILPIIIITYYLLSFYIFHVRFAGQPFPHRPPSAPCRRALPRATDRRTPGPMPRKAPGEAPAEDPETTSLLLGAGHGLFNKGTGSGPSIEHTDHDMVWNSRTPLSAFEKPDTFAKKLEQRRGPVRVSLHTSPITPIQRPTSVCLNLPPPGNDPWAIFYLPCPPFLMQNTQTPQTVCLRYWNSLSDLMGASVMRSVPFCK